MSFRPQKVQKPKVQAKRYRAGQVPENYVDDLSDSEASSEEEEQQQQQQKPTSSLQFAKKDVDTGIQKTEISAQDAQTDRRLRRLLQQQQLSNEPRRRRHVEEDEDEEEENEEEKARERMRLKQRALQSQLDVEEEGEEEAESDQEEEESSSEYESSSEEEDTLSRLPKPVFIPKSRRETILKQEQIAKEEEEREKKLEEELEERKKQSHAMLADELKRENEQDDEKDKGEFEEMPDDTDGLDEEAEFDAWRIRELTRVKRDREERIAREREEEELERRRALPEDVRLKEDLERAKQSKDKDRGQFTFMQKYYHKGAFYQDDDNEVLNRDYTAPTIDEVRNKDLLPKVMQVKNFGLAGRTKYTHLVDQDTSKRDSPWEQPLAKRKRRNDKDNI
ncbi:hypothetical protein K501DRAFT_336319 [Backusella circina FSU 941]|nr:hypothetical protein K501DRAFT_336319 [Backusella circina FSU 941]